MSTESPSASLEDELERARALSVDDLATAIESIGFECTRCGACCRGHGKDEHTATVFPDEVRELGGASEAGDEAVGEAGDKAVGEADDVSRDASSDDNSDDSSEGTSYDWRDVARPMPYGLTEGPNGLEGETFEWALQTDDCGDCTFYTEDGGVGACTVHEDRPLICRTYPFSVVLTGEASEGSSGESDGALSGTSQPMGDVVDEAGVVRAHECEGLGREISRGEAEDLARALKTRAVRELEEAIAVVENYVPAAGAGAGARAADQAVVVHDSEGAKRPDGSRLEDE
ncbi:YkgJ family cysteine cluster protein [Natronosalvus halobius]|uniref:YkgJ family cysteine cluster protein n=1 Tax=Natronosalvus halobius TaxID=2953746 RepID=UPI00209CB24B|nr:YkgJ family cysteine cluster protein [Natronosalvus halobius]USZ73125.1 YkgJ family cysteine cluster protein [Natronosalvus halobius]